VIKGSNPARKIRTVELLKERALCDCVMRLAKMKIKPISTGYEISDSEKE
jgi:hypothetical protein